MRKELLIIQPGRKGDILLVLPIAKYYYDLGYEITWPICNEYQNLFLYVNFPINVIDIGPLTSGIEAYERSKNIGNNFNGTLDLAIGFGNQNLNDEWKKTNLSFDVWKYKKACIPYFHKYLLLKIINRIPEIEKDLLNFFDIKNDPYIVIHQNGSNGRHFDFKIDKAIKTIEIKQFPSNRWEIFDWISLLQGARKIYCVDSCFLNLIDQCKIIPPDGRFVHFWNEYYSLKDLPLLSPFVSNDWISV